jgi:hypothetical protein
MPDTGSIDTVRLKYERLQALMTERLRRRWAACEALALGRGGIVTVAAATGLSRTTIWSGIKEVCGRSPHSDPEPAPERIRRSGAGRPRLTDRDPALVQALEALFEPTTGGPARAPVRWTCQSTRQLAEVLQQKGHQVCDRTVAALLHDLGYRLQANRISRDEGQPAERQAQFEHLSARVQAFQQRGQPVLAVDIREKDWLGAFEPREAEWRPAEMPENGGGPHYAEADIRRVLRPAVHALPGREGWASVGIDRNTALLATETIRRWWRETGSAVNPQARELLLAVDAADRRKRRSWLWQLAAQDLADELGLSIAVCHWPAGTAKWTMIQQRTTCQLTQDGPGRPRRSRVVVLDLIGQPTSKSREAGEAARDLQRRDTKLRVAEAKTPAVHLRRDPFHGEWNYTIAPRG